MITYCWVSPEKKNFRFFADTKVFRVFLIPPRKVIHILNIRNGKQIMWLR